jgi:hypothetical protein
MATAGSDYDGLRQMGYTDHQIDMIQRSHGNAQGQASMPAPISGRRATSGQGWGNDADIRATLATTQGVRDFDAREQRAAIGREMAQKYNVTAEFSNLPLVDRINGGGR